MSKALIGTHRGQAEKVYNENIGGGIYKVFAFEKGDVIDHLLCSDLTPGSLKLSGANVLWLLPNENGGITLMFPEDY